MASAELMTGEELQAGLKALPQHARASLLTAVKISTATDSPMADSPDGTTVVYVHCVDHHVVVDIGHTDPTHGVSVYDGTIVTSQHC
jgi:hypothetical protein